MKYIITIIIIALFSPVLCKAGLAPDFSSIKSVDERKAAFFKYMLPMISDINKSVLADRKKLQRIMSGLEQRNESFIARLSREYRVPSRSLNDLLMRVDVVPPSLALSQGANESNWGRSRFMKSGNAAFGEWCFNSGCGIIPKRRPKNKVYEVKSFPSVFESVKSYVRNLNTGNAYEKLRLMRFNARKNGNKVTGHALANGVIKYSTRGSEYVREIQQIIKHNKLVQYD